MYESYYQSYAYAASEAAKKPLPLSNVFEPIVIAGGLESVADYQLYCLAQADYLADH